MKHFDLQEYLKNPDRKLVTRDGRSARIICTDRLGRWPIVALISDDGGEVVGSFTTDGKKYIPEAEKSFTDLFFEPTKKTGWINLYDLRGKIVCGVVYASEKAARGEIDPNKSYITTIPIEWEE